MTKTLDEYRMLRIWINEHRSQIINRRVRGCDGGNYPRQHRLLRLIVQAEQYADTLAEVLKGRGEI